MASEVQVAEMTARIQQLEETLRRLMSGGEHGGGQGGGEQRASRPMPMTARRAFSTLPRYPGKAEEFDNWKFQMSQFLSEEPQYIAFLEWIEMRQDEIQKEDLTEYTLSVEGLVDVETEWMNHQLYQVLSLNCIGDALVQIKNLKGFPATRGANAWLKLIKEHEGMSAQRLSGLVGRVYEPERVKRYQDARVALELWELRLREHEAATKQKTPEIAKIYAIKKLVPVELEKDIQRLSSSLTTYLETKRYVVEQIAARKKT